MIELRLPASFLRPLLSIALMWGAVGAAHSAVADPLVLQSVMDGVSTTQHLAVLEDRERNLTLDAVRSDPWRSRFAPVEKERTSQGVSPSAWWVRLQVYNPHTTPVAWVADFTHPLTDYVDAYRITTDGRVEHLESGDHRPEQLQPLSSDGIALPFVTAPGAEDEIYFLLRFEREGIIDFHHQIWTKEAFTQHQQFLTGINGLVLGIAGAMFFYNLIIFFSFRAPEYRWYLLYLLSAIAMFLTQTGLAGRYLWEDWFAFKDSLPVVGAQAVLLFGIQFSRAFLNTRDRVPRIDRMLLGMLLLDGLSILLLVLGLRALAIQTVFVLGLLFALFPLLGAWLWLRGHKIARSYTLAWTMLTVLTTTSVLRYMGWIPSDPALNWMVRAGYILEGLLLAMALADRISLLKTQKETAEQAERRSREQGLEQLEREVEIRTAALVEARRIADEQARTDALSGLPNRRAFFEQAGQELKRAKRYGKPLCVIMLDIDRFKHINDTYGHAAGDRVIRNIAEMAGAVLRDSDLPARIGGEEFALLLPESTLEGAMTVAERLRKRIAEAPMQVDDALLHVTASFGVAAYGPDNETVDDLLAAADQVLYVAKRTGRNRVVCAQGEIAARPA